MQFYVRINWTGGIIYDPTVVACDPLIKMPSKEVCSDYILHVCLFYEILRTDDFSFHSFLLWKGQTVVNNKTLMALDWWPVLLVLYCSLYVHDSMKLHWFMQLETAVKHQENWSAIYGPQGFIVFIPVNPLPLHPPNASIFSDFIFASLRYT